MYELIVVVGFFYSFLNNSSTSSFDNFLAPGGKPWEYCLARLGYKGGSGHFSLSNLLWIFPIREKQM